MALISLKAEARKGKYGVVSIMNADGTLNREYRITRLELDELQKSANGIPPGCTKEEWEGGRAIVLGMDFDVGDYRIENDFLQIKYAEQIEKGRIVDYGVLFFPGEWTEILGVISVEKTTLDSKNLIELTSLTAGVLEVDMTKVPLGSSL